MVDLVVEPKKWGHIIIQQTEGHKTLKGSKSLPIYNFNGTVVELKILIKGLLEKQAAGIMFEGKKRKK